MTGRLAGAVSNLLALAVLVFALASALGSVVVLAIAADCVVAAAWYIAGRLGRRAAVRGRS